MTYIPEDQTALEQRSPEWFAARLGKLTGSRAKAVLARTKAGKPTAEYEATLWKLVAERWTQAAEPQFVTAAMQWGQDHEAEARQAYEFETGEEVEVVGLFNHPTIPNLAASPDGLVGEDGMVEIKCPLSSTHARRVAAGVVPEEYRPQMMLGLLCTGRKWCDYVDFDPLCKGEFEDRRLFIRRYEPTPEERAAAEAAFTEFLNRVDAAVSGSKE